MDKKHPGGALSHTDDVLSPFSCSCAIISRRVYLERDTIAHQPKDCGHFSEFLCGSIFIKLGFSTTKSKHKIKKPENGKCVFYIRQLGTGGSMLVFGAGIFSAGCGGFSAQAYGALSPEGKR